MSESEHRFPKRLYQQGSEPDQRFSLANERTFLAWIRTALALLSGGVALAALNQAIPTTGHKFISLILLAAGTIAPPYAWWSWVRNERALRLQRPLPSPILTLPLALLVIIIGLGLALTLWF